MLKDLEFVSRLGSCFGSIGMVLLARKGSKLLAVKKIDLERVDTKDLISLQKEILLARQLLHPNVNTIENSFVDSHCVYIISSAAGYCSCADLIVNHFPDGLNESALALIMRDILHALAYLHSRRIIHRAVRGRHILVTGSGKAVLSCLRHAQITQSSSPCFNFSERDTENLNWLSPEILAQDADGYNYKSDIYSIGMTCLELKNGVPPYNDVGPTYMLVQKLDGWVPTFTHSVSSALEHVVKACTVNATDRPSAGVLLNFPFFKMKGDLRSYLHPVIPLATNVHFDANDLNTILSNSSKLADVALNHTDWDFG